MTRKELTQEMRAISEMMGKTKNCTKTEWERTNKKQYAEYKAEHDRLRAEYDRKYAGSTTSPEKREKPRKTASAPAKSKGSAKQGKSVPRKPSFDVKATYTRVAKPAVGTKEERIKRITALGLSREAAVKAIKAEDEYRAREQRIQSAMPKKPTDAPTYTVWDGKRGKTFATAGEASGYAEEYRKKTGEILTITQTKRKATHEYGKQSKK